MSGYFVTGTGTSVGKTYITARLVAEISQVCPSVITQKWVQTGTILADDMAQHGCVLDPTLADALSPLRCPYQFEFPASPHLAAKQAGTPIEKASIITAFHALGSQFEIVIVEGTGGALTPYSSDAFLIDIAIELGLEIVLVVDNRLGAIHAALSTLEAIRTRGGQVSHIVFNQTTPDVDPRILLDNREFITRYHSSNGRPENRYSEIRYNRLS